MANIYDFTVKDMNEKEVKLSDYAGKVVLIINSATECGFTPQYTDLQEIYSDLSYKGLVILDFPCNQFANQAPASNDEIHKFCIGRFGVTFPQLAKVDVNGENADPLWKYLTSTTKFEGFDGPGKIALTPIVKKMDKDFKNNGNIKWNFTKFLFDRDGNFVARFEPTKDMKIVRKEIEKLL